MKKLLLIVSCLLLLIILSFLLIKSPLARKFNSKGLQFYGSSDYTKAEEFFIKSLKWKKNYEEGLINLTKCEIELKNYDKAWETLEKLKNISSGHAETTALEGQLYVIKQDFETALELLNRSIATDSLLAYAYFYRGIANANLGNLEAAANDYNKAQELDKTNKEALQRGVVILSRLENFEGAITKYNKLLELDPTNTRAYFERGNFKMKIGDFAGAAEDFGQTIKLDNTLAEAYYNRGKSNVNLERFEEAIPDFVRSAELNFKNAGAYYNAGLASLKISRLEDARKYLLQCIKADEQNEHTSMAYHLLGVMEMMRGRNEASIGYFDHSIKLDSAFSDSYYNRAIAYGMLKDYRPAIRDLNKCIELGNVSADVYFARGVNKISLSNFAAGCDDLKEAQKMGHQQAAEMRDQYCRQYP